MLAVFTEIKLDPCQERVPDPLEMEYWQDWWKYNSDELLPRQLVTDNNIRS